MDSGLLQAGLAGILQVLENFCLPEPVLRQTSATSDTTVPSSIWRSPKATCAGPYLNSS